MDVTILNIKKSIDITSVVIHTPKSGEVKMFFCYNCQNPLFQYMGNVISITRGSTPSIPPVIIRCNRCKNTIQIVDIE